MICKIILKLSTIIDVAYKKISGTWCYPRYGDLSYIERNIDVALVLERSLYVAKERCFHDDECKGVYVSDCGEEDSQHLESSKIAIAFCHIKGVIGNVHRSSCVHKKTGNIYTIQTFPNSV